MKRTRLDNWICEIESLPRLTREGLELLQLRRLNETLARVKARGGIYAGYPEKLDSLSQLRELPFTTPAMPVPRGSWMGWKGRWAAGCTPITAAGSAVWVGR